ncbi:MAG: class I SAM-dependent methyltransferase [Anaerolineales bacterium]|nr:class I SAM-dependent methyltransferase [Anaerolineales bacterium]
MSDAALDDNAPFPGLMLLSSPDWKDYELLDSGQGAKLERYGRYTFVRPEHQAVWRPALPPERWAAAHAVFQPTGEESGGQWKFNRPVEPEWVMSYKSLRFKAHASASRHMGIFPEQAAHWDWFGGLIQQARQPVQVLNLFGYTGLASLAATQAGAAVTHVDASKKALAQGKANQALSGLEDRPIRWLVDDAFKFVQREVRRGSHYDGLILDPPKFGRGPQGQVWELFESLPGLLVDCRAILSDRPLFIVITAYAIRASALSMYYAMQEMTSGLGGAVTAGELTLVERSAGRLLSTALYARWSKENQS